METIKHYNPEYTLNFNSEHTLLLTFQYEDYRGYLVTAMGGNVVGIEVMPADFECGLTVPVDHEINKTHANYSIGDEDEPYRYVESVNLVCGVDGSELELHIEELGQYLVAIQIIKYEANQEEE
jgi:hypothetical protein